MKKDLAVKNDQLPLFHVNRHCTAVGSSAACQQNSPQVTLTSPYQLSTLIWDHGHQLLTCSPWWAWTAWAEISILPFLLCCCSSAPSAVHASHSSAGTASAARDKSGVQEGSVAPTFPLIVFHCQECEIALPGPEQLAWGWWDVCFWFRWFVLKEWDLFLVVTWYKRRHSVKLLFTFIPIKEWVLSLFNLYFNAN